jgi:hypothetical protein
MTEANELRPYEEMPPKRKSRRGWWVIGILVIVAALLATCIKGGMDVYRAIDQRSDATREIAMEFMRSGFRDAADPIYSVRGGFTQPLIEELNDTIELYGKASKFSEATCGMVTAANTDAPKAGTFSNCYLTAQVPRSNVKIAVSWVREDKQWKLIGFNINYLNEAPMREREAARANEAAGSDTAPE